MFNIKFEQYKLKLKIIPCSDHCIKTLLMLISLVCMTFQLKLQAIQLTVPSFYKRFTFFLTISTMQ